MSLWVDGGRPHDLAGQTGKGSGGARALYRAVELVQVTEARSPPVRVPDGGCGIRVWSLEKETKGTGTLNPKQATKVQKTDLWGPKQ